MTNSIFLDKKAKTQNNNTKIKHKNPCRRYPVIKPGTSYTQSECVTSESSSQLKVLIVVKLFNYFDATDQNVKNKA